jgi:hypothetical protein
MFWMIVFCRVAEYTKCLKYSNDEYVFDFIDFAKKEWSNESCLKKKLKDFSIRYPGVKVSKFKWLSVCNMYDMVNYKYREIKINKSSNFSLEFSLEESLPDIPF